LGLPLSQSFVVFARREGSSMIVKEEERQQQQQKVFQGELHLSSGQIAKTELLSLRE
jgi:hypothetical protein